MARHFSPSHLNYFSGEYNSPEMRRVGMWRVDLLVGGCAAAEAREIFAGEGLLVTALQNSIS